MCIRDRFAHLLQRLAELRDAGLFLLDHGGRGAFDEAGVGQLAVGLGDLAFQARDFLVPVSYTHLDVYKRQFIERVGFYNPVGNEGTENLRIALDRVQHWTSNGAQLSPAVERLVKDYSAKVSAAA